MAIWKSVSVSWYQPWHYKTFIFVLRYFLWKRANVYGQFTSIFLLVLSLSESLSFCYNYLFLCHSLFIQPEASFKLSFWNFQNRSFSRHALKTGVFPDILSKSIKWLFRCVQDLDHNFVTLNLRLHWFLSYIKRSFLWVV